MEYQEVLTPERKARTTKEVEGPYGPWTTLVVEVAGCDHDRAERVFRRWPLRAALHAFRDQTRREQLRQYRHDYLVWCVRRGLLGAKDNPPELPVWVKKEIVASGR